MMDARRTAAKSQAAENDRNADDARMKA